MTIKRGWTAEESDKIRSLAAKIPLEKIALRLGRSAGATAVQACKLRISLRVRDRADLARRAGPAELVTAPAAVERALSIYQQFQQRDLSVLAQAKKILIQQIYAMVDQGETDEQRLTVAGLARLKAVERDHAIKSVRPPVRRNTSQPVS